ncbi:MAG: hypothetical protein LUO82_00575 [Methanomicrobiales archaeon]|nr:hypothetical protein [Methanomicrobiales archaeon]
MGSENCPIFPVSSGVPLISGGLLLLGMVIVGWLLGGTRMMPLVIALLFVAFGMFLLWLGVSR